MARPYDESVDFSDTQRVRAESQELHAAFVEIELELAETFCQLAVTSVHADKAERNVKNALRALAMAGKFAERIECTERKLPRGLDEKFQDVKNSVQNAARRLHADRV